MLLNAFNAYLKSPIRPTKPFISTIKLITINYIGSILISANPDEISVNIRAVQQTISRSSDKNPAFKVVNI